MRIYEGRRVRVEVFSHILPNGRSMEVERVLFPPVVSVLPVLNGSVVLLKQYRPALGAYHLEVPSGVVEGARRRRPRRPGSWRRRRASRRLSWTCSSRGL
jgi:hypothetical protein